jgi:hypothetical protein
LDEVGVAVCFLALVGVVVLGGFLMLFSWFTATRPTDPAMACHTAQGCGISAADHEQIAWPIETHIDDSTTTR